MINFIKSGEFLELVTKYWLLLSIFCAIALITSVALNITPIKNKRIKKLVIILNIILIDFITQFIYKYAFVKIKGYVEFNIWQCIYLASIQSVAVYLIYTILDDTIVSIIYTIIKLFNRNTVVSEIKSVDIDKIVNVFTKDFLRSRNNLNRLEYLKQNRTLYIHSLTVELKSYCKDADVQATNYYKKFIDIWSK